jgi:hypothetical protein
MARRFMMLMLVLGGVAGQAQTGAGACASDEPQSTCNDADRRRDSFRITWVRHAESESNAMSSWAKGAARDAVGTDPTLGPPPEPSLRAAGATTLGGLPFMSSTEWAAAGRPGFAQCKSSLVPDADLTRLGRHQVAAAVADLPQLAADLADPAHPYRGRIYCSYLRRAIKTAVLLALAVHEAQPGLARLEIVPIPHIQECISTHPQWADQTRWDTWAGTPRDWDADTVEQHVRAELPPGQWQGQGGWPPWLVLVRDHILPPPVVSSATTAERGGGAATLLAHAQRVQRFLRYAHEHGLLGPEGAGAGEREGERGAQPPPSPPHMLVISHGAFIRGASCLTHRRITVRGGGGGGGVEPDVTVGARQVTDEQDCPLNKANFNANLAIATLRYDQHSWGVQEPAAASADKQQQGGVVQYAGNDRLQRAGPGPQGGERSGSDRDDDGDGAHTPARPPARPPARLPCAISSR